MHSKTSKQCYKNSKNSAERTSPACIDTKTQATPTLSSPKCTSKPQNINQTLFTLAASPATNPRFKSYTITRHQILHFPPNFFNNSRTLMTNYHGSNYQKISTFHVSIIASTLTAATITGFSVFASNSTLVILIQEQLSKNRIIIDTDNK
ncbi:hypothetical protein POM88_001471 [Heracleum sosnowskyi]|uniref:Uncharacterized protein n=1 Tax=Heracleum sosnowskyi TaxID=360622 RepID=A0AAD8NAV4_9APIA|nr:hypothetical protein POM88_001471 [Heracleum sosnowskyi]